MDQALRDTYESLSQGTGGSLQIDGMKRELLYLCFEEGGHDDAERRLKALTVAAHLEPPDQMRIADPLLNDPDSRIRGYALNLAIAAEQDGIAALRTAVNSHDAEIAVAALARLVTQLDRACTLHARQWIRHTDPRVRAGAARLLGNIAGPAMGVVLGRVAEADPVPAVRLIAAEATRRCTGEESKLVPQNHWEAGPADLSLPKQAPPPPVRRPSMTEGLETLYPEDLEQDTDDTADPDAVRQLVPVAAPDAEEVVQNTPRDWRDPAPLPSSMPSAPLAILKLMGMVAAPDRVHVLTALLNVDISQRSGAISSWGPGADPEIGRGIAIALAVMEDDRQASMLRHMLADPHPGVRAGAAEALGATGTLSMIPPLTNALAAPEPEVRAAAVRGLASMLTKRDRFAMMKDRLGPLADDPDPAVKAAVAKALDAIP